MIYSEETYKIRGACFEVYKIIGCGFLESVYQEALAHEFSLRGVPFATQRQLDVYYKGKLLGIKYIPDFICYDRIIVELKAVSKVQPEHLAQLLNYLKITEMRLGLLVNFNAYPNLEIRRIAL